MGLTYFDNSWCCATPAPQLKLYQAFIFATPALFTFVLLLLILLILIRRRRRMRATSHTRSQFFPRGLFSAPSDRGLSKSIRDALPIVIYSEGCAISKVDNQCAVCLGDYQKNDKLQQLPVCGHVFHKDCVDEWLANHSTCPICRSVPIPSGKRHHDSLGTHEENSLKTHEQQQEKEETLPTQEGREKEEEEEVARTVEQHPTPLVKKSRNCCTGDCEWELKTDVCFSSSSIEALVNC
ncbi:unnamed protein product [Sphagnum troendelagicum]|uniref:RING-type domain-containing protein n=1 Tax=Sphagnum troendelagicum TaxID=128251 RepID=A0ABP0TQX5_9BRYO